MITKSWKTHEIVISLPIFGVFLVFFLILQLALIFILFSSSEGFNKIVLIEPLNEKSLHPLNYNLSAVNDGIFSFILPINMIVCRKNAFPVLLQQLTTEIEMDGFHTGFLVIKEDYLISSERIAITLYPHIKLYGSIARFLLKDKNDLGIRLKLSILIYIDGLKRKHYEEMYFNVCISSECLKVQKNLSSNYFIRNLSVF